MNSDSLITPRPQLAAALAGHRHALALELVKPLGGWDKYAADLAKCEGDFSEFARVELYAFVDFLALYFRTGDVTYQHLYVGEKLRQAYVPNATPDQQQERKVDLVRRDREAMLGFLRGKVGADDLAALEECLAQSDRLVTNRGRYTADLLLVGDCVHIDTVSFLAAGAAADDITLQPTYLSSKNPIELRQSLRAMGQRRFDAVFYSPFTYRYSLELGQLQEVRTSAAGAARILGIVDEAMGDVTTTLDLLSDLFECNIFVHNTANIRRHDGTLKERLKNLATRRARRLARDSVNRRIADYLKRRNAATFPHLHLIDEAALLARLGETELGRKFYSSELQHPAVMGRWLGEEYRDLIAAQVTLVGKKVIACDLDNTLWNGVIGEGAVEHYAQRQATLKALRHKGVVLAVVSKNDPRNVRWDGGVLNGDDFVNTQINWDPKVVSLRRAQEELNLKLKDFVFIDDRADERGLVQENLPQVRTMDATDPRTWRLLDIWGRLTVDDGESDRTRLYKERDQRDRFIETSATQEDPAHLFAKLDLRVTIRQAGTSELKRVAELINRTNQFNLCGSRTTLREVTAWHQDPRRRVIIAEASDKFGQMGTIGVLVLCLLPDRLEIPVFVLSCRVFGYGIEQAVMNAVKRLAAAPGRAALTIWGLYQETPHNEPCRRVYPDSGFTWDGSAWVCAGAEPGADPSWLNVKCDISPWALPTPAAQSA